MNQIPVSDVDVKARSYSVVWILVAIWLASLTLRFSYGVYKLGDYRFQYHSAFVESELARNLVLYGELKAHTKYAFAEPKVMYSVRPPGFPFLLAVSYSIWGIENSVGVLFTLLIFSSLTPIIIYEIGKTVFDKNVGLLSACLFAVYPYSIALESTLSSDMALFTEMLAIHMLIFYKLLSIETSKKSTLAILIFGCGLTIAITSLFRSSALVLVPLPLILTFFLKKRVNMKFLLCFYLIGLGPLMIWGVRNYSLHERIILGTTLDGFNFYKGNNILTHTVYPFVTLDAIESELKISPSILSEGEMNDFYLQKGIGFMRSSYLQSAVNSAIKFILFFSPIIIPMTNAYDGAPRPIIEHVLYTFPYLTILLMAITTIRRNLRYHKDKLLPIILLIIMSSLPYTLTFAYSRYRYPIDVYLIILTAAAFIERMHKRSLKESLRLDL